MSFQTKPFTSIKQEQKKDFDEARNHFRRGRRSRLKYYIIVPLIFVAAFFVVRALVWTYDAVSNFSLTDIVWALSSDLEIEDNHTTILLLGRGGDEHEGPDLTDTIMVATLDHRLKTVSLLSIPRDLFVSVSGYEPARINSVWKLGQMRNDDDEDGYRLVRQVVGQIIGEPIQYHIRVDFSGFENIIDAIGGVYVDVENPFTDYQYPTENYSWQTISFQKGVQRMDGERALQFARSRHGNNDEGSDFRRAIRQQKILMAIRDQILSTGVLTSPDRLSDLYDALNSTFQTDLTIREILALAKFGTEIGQEDVHSFALTDGFDGFLYTPNEEDRHTYYNGWFVLLPLGNDWDIIHEFVDIIWHQGEVYQEDARINILNGTNTQGLAQDCLNYLKRYHLNPVEISNASKLYSETQVYNHSLTENVHTVEILAKLTNATEINALGERRATTGNITLILGSGTACKTW